jgi:hypothetical protein
VTLFSFDTSALIGAHNELYPPATFPGLWRELEALIAAGTLCCSEEVLHELERQDDDLLTWAKAQSGLFVPMDAAIEAAVKRVVIIPNAVKGTSTDNSADPFVVAVAIARSATVVSREGVGSPQRPKIPYLCGQLGVLHQTLEQFVTGQGWKFG